MVDINNLNNAEWWMVLQAHASTCPQRRTFDQAKPGNSKQLPTAVLFFHTFSLYSGFQTLDFCLVE